MSAFWHSPFVVASHALYYMAILTLGAIPHASTLGERVEAGVLDLRAGGRRGHVRAGRVRSCPSWTVQSRPGTCCSRSPPWRPRQRGRPWRREVSPPMGATLWLLLTVIKSTAYKRTKALFRYTQKLKALQDFPSHRILRHMHEALNIDKKDN